MFIKLLEQTNNDLDCALQPQEDRRAQATANRSSCSRTETSSGSPCPPTKAATETPCAHFETENEVIRSNSATISPSRGPLEYVVDGDYHITSNSCYPCLRTELENGCTNSNRLLDLDEPEPDLQRSGEKMKEPKFPYVHRSQIRLFEYRQAVPRSEVQPSEYCYFITTRRGALRVQ